MTFYFIFKPTTSSSVATIFGAPANNLFGPLAKGLRRLLLLGGPLAGPSAPRAPRDRGACGAIATPLTTSRSSYEREPMTQYREVMPAMYCLAYI